MGDAAASVRASSRSVGEVFDLGAVGCTLHGLVTAAMGAAAALGVQRARKAFDPDVD
ncbi:MAG TPA: hypothetical protein H9878_15080 [Candidatus Dietzia merdigallinarum]|nr:hypothetical protein [Candidatus Dietzia merdigallinarum]